MDRFADGSFIVGCIRLRHDGQEKDTDGVCDGAGEKDKGQGHTCEHTINA